MKKFGLFLICAIMCFIPWGILLRPFGLYIQFFGLVIQIIGLIIMIGKKESIWG